MKKADAPHDTDNSLDRLRAFARRIVAVPKEELESKLAEREREKGEPEHQAGRRKAG